MKICNFLRFDSTYAGVGLKAGSTKSKKVWDEFANDIPRLEQVAVAIRASVDSGDDKIRQKSEPKPMTTSKKHRKARSFPVFMGVRRFAVDPPDREELTMAMSATRRAR